MEIMGYSAVEVERAKKVWADAEHWEPAVLLILGGVVKTSFISIKSN